MCECGRVRLHLFLQEVPGIIDDTQDSGSPAASAAITAQHRRRVAQRADVSEHMHVESLTCSG